MGTRPEREQFDPTTLIERRNIQKEVMGVGEKRGRERRASTRKELEIGIEFFVNADIIAARSIDMSKTGLSFDTEAPLNIHMRMEIDGELCDREAQVVWATRNSYDRK